MNNFFYGKLAFLNLKKNQRIYLPYLITAAGVGAMYEILLSILADEGIRQMRGSGDLQSILGFGNGVVAVFAVIVLFYTNSFLMKRRKKEFGLFHVLGMEKRHIGKMMFWETLMTASVSIAGGILAGILLYKLVALVLLRITGLDVPFELTPSAPVAARTAILFAGIFAATFLYNLWQVRKTKPIELLRSAAQGEKEPKTHGLLAVLGILALGAGYGIAVLEQSPLETLTYFFLAVLLVILGTYCLFTAGSVALLKMLRRNKGYYYKTRHFISVSGMIYRMRQNAVGLANICILSTMVLVMVAGTLSVYAGMESILHTRYYGDICLEGQGLIGEEAGKIRELAAQGVKEAGLEQERVTEYATLEFAVWKDGERMQIVKADAAAPAGELSAVEILTLADYERLSGERKELAEDEAIVYTKTGEKGDQSYYFNGKRLRVREYLDEFDLKGMGVEIAYDLYIVIVKNSKVRNELEEIQSKVYQEYASQTEYFLQIDVSGEPEQSVGCAEKIREKIGAYSAGQDAGDAFSVTVEAREEKREEYLVFYGGFLFLGIFLGSIFLMATIMIIYYKQVSEGYEDKERFEIMQKVGMGPKEVKAAIHSQILKVFFLPLFLACVHLAAAFPMMNRLIRMFGMQDAGLFAACTAATVGVFALIYGSVYWMTARTYYKIIK